MAQNLDAALLQVAAFQSGAVSSEQLRELGISRNCVQRRVHAGSMRMLLPNVYAVGPAAIQPGPETWRHAAVLHCRDPAALSHSSAAHRHRLWDRSRPVIHVVSRVGRPQPVTPVPIRFHRSITLTDDDIVDVEGLATTNVVQTVLSLGHELTPFQIPFVLCEATVKRMLELEELQHALESHRGAPATAVVRAAIELFIDGGRGTQSKSEDRLLSGMLAAGAPVPLVSNRRRSPVPGHEPDFSWPASRLIVEVDGSPHDRPGARESDANADDAYREVGWYPHRVDSGRVWTELPTVVAEILALLRTRS